MSCYTHAVSRLANLTLGKKPLLNTTARPNRWVCQEKLAAEEIPPSASQNLAIVLEQLQQVKANLNAASASLLLPVFC